MVTRKVQTILYVEPADLERLRELSKRTGVPMQVYLREGADYVLRKYNGTPPAKPSSR